MSRSCVIVTDESIFALRAKRVLKAGAYQKINLITSLSDAEQSGFCNPDIVIMDTAIKGSITALRKIMRTQSFSFSRKIVISDFPVLNPPHELSDALFLSKEEWESDVFFILKRIDFVEGSINGHSYQLAL